MKVVARDLDLVAISDVVPGGTFRWEGKHYVRTCRSLCEKGIWGVSLENGWSLCNGNTLVKPIDVEARVL